MRRQRLRAAITPPPCWSAAPCYPGATLLGIAPSAWCCSNQDAPRHGEPPVQHPVDHVFATATLSDKQKKAILGGNAVHLFGLKQA